MKKRDRRLITPSRTSLTVGSDKSIQKGLDDLFDFCDAVPESTGPSEKVIDTSSDFYLKGEGTSKKKEEEKSKSGNKDKSYNSGVFPPNPKNNVAVFGPDNKKLKNTNESRATKWVKNGKAQWLDDKTGKDRKAIQLLQPPLGRGKDKQTRVPVLAPDGEPLMPTISSKARKWLRDGKAKIVTNDLGIFQIQLIDEPSDRKKQPIVLLNAERNLRCLVMEIMRPPRERGGLLTTLKYDRRRNRKTEKRKCNCSTIWIIFSRRSNPKRNRDWC